MFEKKIQIQNKAGIHCRPSSMIMGAVELYPGHEFCVESESILDLLALGLQFRDNVTLKVTGPKEQEAGEKIAELFEHVYDFHS